MILILFISLLLQIQAQIKVSPYALYPVYANNLGAISCIEFNADATQLYLCMNGVIANYNITGTTTLTKKGEYAWSPALSYNFLRVHKVTNYFIATNAPTTTPRVFNYSSYAQVTSSGVNQYIVASQVITSKNIWMLGDTIGRIMYFNLGSFPGTPRTYFVSDAVLSVTAMSKTIDETFLAISYETSLRVRVVNLATLTVVSVINLPTGSGGCHTTFFSSDSRYLFVFPYNFDYFLVYSRDSSWTLLNTVPTGYLNVKSCFLYKETDTALCLSPTNQTIFQLSWSNGYNISVKLTGVNANRLQVNTNNNVFFVSDSTLTSIYFYSIKADCPVDSYFNSTSKACVVCSTSCVNCLSTTACSVCSVNFTVSNGSCQACTLTQLYNSTDKTCVEISSLCSGDKFYNVSSSVCVQCRANCAKCSSTTACQYCVTNYTLQNSTCRVCSVIELYNSTTKLCDVVVNTTCSSSDQYFSYTSLKCVQCLIKCAKCLSETSCEYCAENYTLINGTCQACNSNQIYNATTKSCDVISSLCSGNKYFSVPMLFCVVCQEKCAQCLSTTSCGECITNYSLETGTCQVCGSQKVYNSSTKNCTSISTLCTGDEYFSIALMKCVQCLPNCGICSSVNTCSKCAQNHMFASDLTCIFMQMYYTYQEQISNSSTSTSSSLQDIFRGLMKSTLNNTVLKQANTVPASRIVLTQIFSFFFNLDHFWLYIYHKRKYGSSMQSFLTSIRDLQNQKWSSVSEGFLSNNLHIDWEKMGANLNFKAPETSWKYFDIEGTSSSFFANTLHFFILNIPMVFVMYILMRAFFFLTFKYKISMVFREYSFKLFFVTMLMEGNLESFTYFFFFDVIHMISKIFLNKFLNILTTSFFLVFVWHVVCWFFMIKIIQKEDSRYFFGNYHPNLQTLIHMTFESNLLNFFLGACHILMENHYGNQLTILGGIEVFYIVLQIVSISRRKGYCLKYIGWQNIVTALMRVLLIVTFSFDAQLIGEVKEIFNQAQMVIIILCLANWIVSIVLSLLRSSMVLIKFVANKLSICQEAGIRTNNDLKLVLKERNKHQIFFTPSQRPSVIPLNQIAELTAKPSLMKSGFKAQKPEKRKQKRISFQIVDQNEIEPIKAKESVFKQMSKTKKSRRKLKNHYQHMLNKSMNLSAYRDEYSGLLKSSNIKSQFHPQ